MTEKFQAKQYDPSCAAESHFESSSSSHPMPPKESNYKFWTIKWQLLEKLASNQKLMNTSKHSALKRKESLVYDSHTVQWLALKP